MIMMRSFANDFTVLVCADAITSMFRDVKIVSILFNGDKTYPYSLWLEITDTEEVTIDNIRHTLPIPHTTIDMIDDVICGAMENEKQ